MPGLPLVGDEFAGYRLRAVLGRGGMSVVYQAENPRLGNVIALKVLAPELAGDDIFRTRFLEESRIAASMNHPNVIPIHDMGSSDGLLYIAMRYVTGTDLRQMIKKRGRLQPETAVFLLGQAARALDAAHAKGLVHRDVKPGNLLIERGNDDSEPDHLYLADFGITKKGVTRTGLTSTGQFLGTVDYVAPEQIRGLSVLGMADQYSLGCVLYECLTGRVPFEKDLDAAIIWAHMEEHPAQPTVLRPDLPPAVDEVFARVLAKQPGDRYPNCREFIEAARVVLGPMAAATAPGTLPRSPDPAAAEPGHATDHPATAVSAGYAAAPAAPGSPPEAAPAGYPEGPADAGHPAGPPSGDPAEGGLAGDPAPGYPGELAHQEGSSGPATETIFAGAPAGRPPRKSTLTSHRRPDAAAPPGGGDGSGGGEPPGGRGPRAGWLRSRWLAVAAALVVLAGAGGAYAALSGGTPAKPHAGAPASATANGTTTQSAKPSKLMNVLANTNNSSIAKGKLPPSSCKQQSATMVTCTAPAPGIAQAVFTTYPTLTALYAAYQAKIESLNSGQFGQNVQDCGLIAPSPYGEVSWNHDEQHPRTYTVAEMAAGKVPFASAAGRMACIATANGSEDIIWTGNIGKMLAVVTGSGPVAKVWYWWIAVHHWIIFPGTPSMASMGSCSPVMAQATGCTVPKSPESLPSMSSSSSAAASNKPTQPPSSQSRSP